MDVAREIRGGYRLVPFVEEDAAEALRIFNEHVASGLAAYPEEPVPETFIVGLLRSAAGYPALAAEDAEGRFVGFGLLRPYSPVPAFAGTAVTSIFLSSAHPGRGVGSAILRALLGKAKEKGITKVLAHVSSRNPRSVAFHRKHGFVECGRFPGVGRKWDQTFDVIWTVKDLASKTEKTVSD